MQRDGEGGKCVLTCKQLRVLILVLILSERSWDSIWEDVTTLAEAALGDVESCGC